MPVQPIKNFGSRELKRLFLHKRWPWHLIFWLGYALFRFWVYYITVKYYAPIFLEYMLLSEILFVAATYFTLWLYRLQLQKRKYLSYFIIGAGIWILYLWGRTEFQFFYLKDEPRFRGNSYTDIIFNNIAFVLLYFLLITTCKYFKDGFISQQFEAEKKEQQLMAEVNNLKSQIAPHFLFNTLNNLYGLAVEKSDLLPSLMLRLSDLLRHSIYETQKSMVGINEEIKTLESYMELESIRLEDDLELTFENEVPEGSPYAIAPLLLIVFVENAFKHSRLVQSSPIKIYVGTALEENKFTLITRNNYNKNKPASKLGIGLVNVKRRLEVLYPQHQLVITKDENVFTVNLQIPLVKLM